MTIKAIFVSMVLLSLFIPVLLLLTVMTGSPFDREAVLVLFFAANSIVGIIRKILPKSSLPKPEQGFIYTFLESALNLTIGYQLLVAGILFIGAMAVYFPEASSYLKPFMAPERESLDSFLNRGPLHVEDWIMPLLFYLSFGLLFAYLGFFLILPFQRLMTEKERVPFPLAQAAASIFQGLFSRAKSKKWVTYGILVGFLLGVIRKDGLLQLLIPGFPAVPTFIDLSGYLQGTLPGASLAWYWSPELLGLSFIVPLEVQVASVLFSYIFYVLIPPIEVVNGMLPWSSGLSGREYQFLAFTHGLSFGQMAVGGILAIGVSSMLLWQEELRSILTKGKRKIRIVVRRRLYLLLAVITASMLCMIYLGVPIEVTVVTLVLNLLLWIGLTKCVGYGGWMLGSDWWLMNMISRLFFSQSTMSQAHFNSQITWSMASRQGSNGAATSAETFKLASLFKTEEKSAMIAQISGAAIGLVLGLIWLILLATTLGSLSDVFPLWTNSQAIPIIITGALKGEAVPLNQFSMGVGFAAVLLMLYLGSFQNIFTLIPYGFIFGLQLGTTLCSMYLLTGITRWAFTVRYGKRRYNSVALPFTAGMIGGGVLERFTYSVAFAATKFGWNGQAIGGGLTILILLTTLYQARPLKL